MNNDFYINNFNFNLTGTNFGLLNQYNKINYINGYYFLNMYGEDFLYSNNISGGIMLEKYNNNEIKNLSDLILWLDSSDSSTYTLSSNINTTILLSLSDKSGNDHVFKRKDTTTDILTAFWPVEKNYSFNSKDFINANYNYYKDFLKCFNFGYNNVISCSTFSVDMKKPFSFYFVWKNNFLINPLETSSEKSIPFSFITTVDTVTSELVPHISVTSVPNIAMGIRDNDDAYVYGFKINELSSYKIDLFLPNVLEFTYDGTLVQDVSTQSVFFNGTKYLSSDGSFIINDIFGKEYLTSIGYNGDNNTNNFYFCEMIAFSGILSQTEREKLLNSIFNKWYIEVGYNNVSYKETITGDTLKNSTYEDFSLLTSNYEIPVQSCVTLLTINLSSYDETVSEIKKIECEYNNKIIELNPSITTTSLTNNFSIFKNNVINIILEPVEETYIKSFTVSLCVYKFDETVNKINLFGNITKCGVLDLFKNTSLLDSQIGDSINSSLLVLENKNLRQLYLNKLDTSLEKIYLSGGDKVVLQSDIIVSSEELITLLDLLEVDVEVSPTRYKVPFISQPISIESNPILNT